MKPGIVNLRALFPGEQEWKRRAGTENVLGAILLAEAIRSRLPQKAQVVQSQIWQQQLQNLESELVELFPKIDFLSPRPENDRNRLPQTTFFRIPGVQGHRAVLLLDQLGVCASVGTACKSGLVEPNTTALALGYNKTQALECIRVSLDWNSTDDDIMRIIQAFRRLAEKHTHS